MKSILLIGLGRFGKHIALSLNEFHHQVMVVDQDEEKINEILPYVTSAQIGDSTNEEFLDSLGIGNFDVCIVAIGADFQSSLETTSLLKEHGAKFVVSRAASEVHSKFLMRNGADHVVYPEKEMAKFVAIRYGSDNVFDYIEVGNDYVMYKVSTPRQWDGKTVGQIELRKKFNINILAVMVDNEMNHSVTPDTVLHAGEKLLLLGRSKDVQKCFSF